jgi:membrane-associated phospholipid phosphatase
MKNRIHILIIIGLLLVGFVLGSFFDLQIDKALFMENNHFGLIMASFGVYPCYAGLAFIGGGLLSTGIKRKDLPLFAKIISYVLAGLAYIMAIYLCGKEWPSTNGYNVPKLAPLSYAISAVVFGGVFVGAFFVCQKGNLKQLWNILMVMTVIFVVALLPAGFVIKLIIHRPRYRYAVRLGAVDFKNWWEMFPGYKELLGQEVGGHILDKEEFKSFPSGHSGTGMIMAMFLPFASFFFPKLKGKETILFYGGVAFGLVMMFSRLLVGAHYLTDTCMGSLIVMVVFFVVNEFALRKKIYDEPVSQEAPALEGAK